jgi:hypothetical protein
MQCSWGSVIVPEIKFLVLCVAMLLRWVGGVSRAKRLLCLKLSASQKDSFVSFGVLVLATVSLWVK